MSSQFSFHRAWRFASLVSLLALAGCGGDPYKGVDPELVRRNSGSLTMAGGLIFPNEPGGEISKTPFKGGAPAEFCNGPLRSTIYVREGTLRQVQAQPDRIREFLPTLASANKSFELCKEAQVEESTGRKIVRFFQNPFGE